MARRSRSPDSTSLPSSASCRADASSCTAPTTTCGSSRAGTASARGRSSTRCSPRSSSGRRRSASPRSSPARLGVTLDKSSQRADWSRRPLTPSARRPTPRPTSSTCTRSSALLEADLAARGRLEWHAEECARLLAQDLSPAPDDPETDWRIKGSNALSAKERAFLRELWSAREERARALDLPPFRVLHNETLLSLSRKAASGERDLAALFPRPVPAGFAGRLREALETARALPPTAWPPARRGEIVRPEPELEKAVYALKARRDAVAARLGLDPGVLASRAALVDVARAELAARAPLAPADLVAATGLSRWKAELLAAGVRS